MSDGEENGRTTRDLTPSLLAFDDEIRAERNAAEAKRVAEKARLLAERSFDQWALVQHSLDTHARRLDQSITTLQENDARQNQELSRIGTSLRTLDRATGRLLDEADDRRKASVARSNADRTRDASLKRIELYMKLLASLLALLGAFWTVLHWAVVHYK